MIKAIPTKYSGYEFRSRLEARWAIFFDRIGLAWDYEAEGYDLDGVWYLPDFKVYSKHTGAVSYYEIKPQDKTQDDKFDRFVSYGRFANNFKLLNGDPYYYFMQKSHCYPNICPRCGQINNWFSEKSSFKDGEFFHCSFYVDCEDCDYTTPCGSGNDIPSEIGIMNVKVQPHKGSIMLSGYGSETDYMEKFNGILEYCRQYKFHR